MTATVRTQVDERVKQEAAAVLSAMGLSVSDAVRMLMTKIVAEKTLPFDPYVPNKETIAAMREVRQGGLPRFDTVEALFKDLNEDD